MRSLLPDPAALPVRDEARRGTPDEESPPPPIEVSGGSRTRLPPPPDEAVVCWDRLGMDGRLGWVGGSSEIRRGERSRLWITTWRFPAKPSPPPVGGDITAGFGVPSDTSLLAALLSVLVLLVVAAFVALVVFSLLGGELPAVSGGGVGVLLSVSVAGGSVILLLLSSPQGAAFQ